MATPPNDDTKTLFRLLADGEWHDYVAIRDAIAATVPPGRALRKYQERVEYKRKYTNDPSYDTDATEDERIYYGARACGQIVITSWKGRGIDFTGSAETKKIRRKPGFTTWGIEHLPDDPKEPEEGEGVAEVPPADSAPSEAVAAPLEGEEPGPAEASQCDCIPSPEEWAAEAGENGAVSFLGPCEGLPGQEPAEGTEEEEEPTARQLRERDPFPRMATSQSVAMESLPHCEECGLWIVDRDKHKSWHIAVSERNASDDMALFSESEVRHLIEGIVSKQLDEFQVGMQKYLTAQFALLEGTIAAVAGMPWRASREPFRNIH